MFKSHCIVAALGIAALTLCTANAQYPSSTNRDSHPIVTAFVYRDVVRLGVDDARELRVEVFDFAGKRIFDSGFVEGCSIDWSTKDQRGRPVENSVFAHSLSFKDRSGEVRIAAQGNVIIDRERNTLADAPTLEAASGNLHKNGAVHLGTDRAFEANVTDGAYRIATARASTRNPLFRIDLSATAPRLAARGASLPLESSSPASSVAEATSIRAMFVENTVFGTNAGSSLTTGDRNSFFGSSAGILDTTGSGNSFFGHQAGKNNAIGGSNSFFGSAAGQMNKGDGNSFFGASAGFSNVVGPENSFFGNQAGKANQYGKSNSFFGSNAGVSNKDGGYNTFAGFFAGQANFNGGENTFIGSYAGKSNLTGTSNTFVGYGAGPSNTSEHGNSFIGAQSTGAAGITNATAVGAKASVTRSNSLVLGSISGINGATATASVGIGTPEPRQQLHVEGGNIYVGKAGRGIILKSPGPSPFCKLLTIGASGDLLLTTVTCP